MIAPARLVEAVARSRYASDTIVLAVEDDAQDGPDHVDAHRSTAFIVGPYVKKNAVVSTHYTTVNLLRTISDILGIDHLGIYDANQRPMSDVFDLSQPSWTYTATASGLLKSTTLPLPPGVIFAGGKPSRYGADYWIARTRGMDFSEEDKVDSVLYNRLLWKGLMGRPYPANGGRPLTALSVAQARTPARKDDD